MSILINVFKLTNVITLSRHKSLIFIILFSIAVFFPYNKAASISSDNIIPNFETNFILDSNQMLEDNSKTLQSREEFGNQEDFWTANLQTNEWFTVRATLLAVGENCYIYMDNRTIYSLGQTEATRRSNIFSYEFDTTIYPKNYELMGNPNGTLGDIDGDPRITVFLVQGVGSYYLQQNELYGYTYSNYREMVYVNSKKDIYNTISVICHETNHLFLFNYDLDEAVFMIEGLAEFSEYYAGYMSNSSFISGDMVLNVTYPATNYLDYPSVSLLYFDKNYYSHVSYGSAYMFLFYLAEKYSIQIIKDLISIDELDGPEAIEFVLSEYGYDLTFNDIFLDFITACTIDKISIYNDLYGFVNADFKINSRTQISSLPQNFTATDYRYYGIEIMQINDASDKFTLELETPNEPGSLGVVIIIQDDNGWNITQNVHTGDGKTIRLYCNGDDIQRAYIVTSKIRLSIKVGPRTWEASPISKLDFSVESGHNNPALKTKISLLSILPVVFFFALYHRKRKIKLH